LAGGGRKEERLEVNGKARGGGGQSPAPRRTEEGADMAKQHEDNCTYVVIMEGVNGDLYETRCDTPEEAVRLERHHMALGWFAWIEIEKEA